jgi:hypothetical protein
MTMNAMTKYLAGVLTVIAFGVTAIAYSLIAPRVTTLDAREPAMANMATGAPAYAYPASQVQFASPPSNYPTTTYPANTYPVNAYPAASAPMAIPQAQPVQAVRTVEVEPAPRRVVTRTVERAPRRDWKKTALVIGGSTAAGAGLGGILGGKKGALIGAAIGGGASTIYQTTR